MLGVSLGLAACGTKPPVVAQASPIERSVEPPIGDAITATFFGTSTLLLDDGRHVVLIDGFVTRPNLLRVVFGTVSSDPALVDAAFSNRLANRKVAVLVSHTHYDHALDAGTIASRWGAEVHGSTSTAALLHAERVDDDLINVITPDVPFHVGDFSVTAISTPHSPGDLARGQVTRPPRLPTTARVYRTGESYSFLIEHGDRRILVVPSAHHGHGALGGLRADVVFLGVGMLGKQSDDFIARYWCETVLRSGAFLVVPMHWDDLTRPLIAPLPEAPRWIDRVDEALSALEVFAERDGVEVARMDAFEVATIERAQTVREPRTACDA